MGGGNMRRLNRGIDAAALVAAAFVGAIVIAACVLVWRQAQQVDFVEFWAAGKMVLGGNSAGVYDIVAHHAVEQSAVPSIRILPFPYPPPFALLLVPFALLPFRASFTLWVLVTGALYVLASMQWMRPRLALAQPSALINGFIGQSAFLTSALFFGGALLLPSWPAIGGALFGALIIKPHLGIMIPVALVAGRQWRAIGGAALSCIALLAAGWIFLGTSAYHGFFAMMPQIGRFIAEGRASWHELASIFALLSYFGVPASAALAVHAAVALAAAVVLWRAWSSNRDGKEAMLASATLLGSPYLQSYDALLLALPVAWLLARAPALAILVWLLALLPVGAIFGLYDLPNTMPLAALLSLIAIDRIGSRASVRAQ